MSTKNRRSKRNRSPLSSLSDNDLNQTKRKRRQRRKNKSNASKTTTMEAVDENSKEIETEIEDPFDMNSIHEPPKKKRKTEARHSLLSPMPFNPICAEPDKKATHEDNTRNSNRNQVKQSISSRNIHSIHHGGKLQDIQRQRAAPMQKDDAFNKLKANNNLLTKQVIKYREHCKLYEKKCKTLKHENGSFKKLIQSLNEREKRLKKQRRSNQDKITELELKNEEITNELNKSSQSNHNNTRDSNHDDHITSDLNHKISNMEYECDRWKTKYNQLLNTSSTKCQESDSRIRSLQQEMERSVSLFEIEKKALEDDRKGLRQEHRNLIERTKANHVKMKRLKLQTKAACTQLKKVESEVAKYKNDLNEMEEKYEHLMDEKEQKYKHMMSETESKYQKEMKLELQRQQHENDHNMDKMEEMKNEIMILERDRSNCMEFHVNRRDIDLLQKDLSEIRQKYDETALNLKELQRKTIKIQKEAAALKTTNEELEENNTKYKQEINASNKKLKELNESHKCKANQCLELKNRINALTSDITALQKRYNSAKREVDDAETIRLSFESEKGLLNREIKRYCHKLEGLQYRMQSLWRRYDAEKTKARMWKMKLKTLAEHQSKRINNVNEWLLQCRENEFELNDYDRFDAAQHSTMNAGDHILGSPVAPSPFSAREKQSEKENDVNQKEEASASDYESDIDIERDNGINTTVYLSPIQSERNKGSGSDVSTPSQFDYSVGTPSSSCFNSDDDSDH